MDDENLTEVEEPLYNQALQMSWDIVDILRELKSIDSQNGRLWAIALTDAEKLHAWISYAGSTVEE